MSKHVLPYLGDLPVSEVTTPLVRDVLKRIEDRGTIETAHRVKYIIGQVCRFAASHGLTDNDPTTLLRDALKKTEERSFPSITDPIKLGAMLRAIDVYTGSFVVKIALPLLPLVFVRSGGLRGARRNEFDLDQSM
ncbi:MAG: integrase, partial [Gammaproteobacteria bacterium]